MPARIEKRLEALPQRAAAFVEPMECLPVAKLPEGSDWLWEIKLDGYRALAVKSAGAAHLFPTAEILQPYPYLVEALRDLPEGTVVDGEVVALDPDGRPNFHLLQRFRSEASRIRYFIFDLLVYRARDLTQLPLEERNELLKKVLHLASPLIAEKMKECVWLRPEAVAQVEFLEWTEADRLRHTKFVALRSDKDPRQVVKEQAEKN